IVSGIPNGCVRYDNTVVDQPGTAITATVTNLVPNNPNISCTQVYGTNQSHTEITGEFDPCSTYTVVVNGDKHSVQPQLHVPIGTGVRQQLEIADPAILCGGSSQPAASGDQEHVLAPIENVEIVIAESFPVQYFVAITLGLPNACYDFNEAVVERDGAVVRIEVTNLGPVDPNMACAEIYRTVVENVALGSDFDQAVAYTVDVNGTSYPLKPAGSGSLPMPTVPNLPNVPGDEFKQVPAPIESVHLNIIDSMAGETTLTVLSGLPSGCAKLTFFDVSQRGDLITVTVLNSIPTDTNLTCTAIYGIEENKALLSGSYTPCETYTVEVNGEPRQIQAIDPAVRCRAPEPAPDTQGREHVPAPIENLKILATRSLPPQYTVIITYGLPNACYDPGTHEVTTDGTTVRISVTNLAPADANQACAEIYRMMDIEVHLGSDFKPGVQYIVDVNGKTTPLEPVVSAPPVPSVDDTAEYGEPFGIAEGGTVNVGDESLVIKLESINDSRCPANVVCVWAGEAKIVVSATMQGEFVGVGEITLEMQKSAPATADLGDFVVRFVSLDPYPGAQGQTAPPPVATLIVQPKQTNSTGNSDSEATTKLNFEPVAGSPLTVLLIADIVGGADDDQDLYCQGVTWDFGDGNQIAMMPGCIMFTKGSSFNRHWEETYTYEKPGAYPVSFTYGPMATASIQVTVK
ncbi:MAG: hypothetical protein QF368_14820, partial [SAR202 cluster bacterium]|nr:hypothetical protein [SAR202 cluster bacterium]